MKYKLICFDLDGTIVDDTEYIWITLHDMFGVPKEVRRKHYLAYTNKEITYQQWFNSDISEWKKRGKTKKDFIDEVNKLKLMEGAKETVYALKEKGYKLALISGSLKIVVDTLFPDHPFNDVFINELVFDKDDNLIDGKATPFDMERKADGMRMIAEREGLSLKECVFIGDNKNDIHIAEIAGFTISFNSKSERLNELADVIIEKKDLREVLKYL